MTEGHLSLDQLELICTGSEVSSELRSHLDGCDSCQKELACLRMLHKPLDLSCVKGRGEKVLQLRRDRRRRSLQRITAVASVFIACFFTVIGFSLHEDHQARELSVAWLESQQASDGSWKVEEWGGKPRFRVGISSMALLAILEEPSHDKNVVTKGLDYLLRQQQPSGGIGEEFLGDLYNHSLATLVLSRAKANGYKIPPFSMNLAKDYLEGQRQEKGRWGYRLNMLPEHNLSSWASRALDEAMARPQAEFGTAVASSSETFLTIRGPSTKHPDAMSAYLNEWTMSHQEKKEWRDSLLSKQEREGALAGSWPADDRWGRVGGRVFCTGMAVLALD